MKRVLFGVAMGAMALLASNWIAEPIRAAVILSQNFDDTGTYFPGMTGVVGDASTVGGRWGSFDDPNIDISNTIANSGTQSVSVTRNIPLIVGRVDVPVSTPDYEISYSIFRPATDTGQFIMQVGDSTVNNDLNLATFTRNGGEVHFIGPGPAWYFSGAVVPLEEWTEIRLAVDESAGTYDLYVGGAFATTVTPAAFPPLIDRVRLNAQNGDGTTVLIDDISIIDTSVPEPSSLAMLGLSALVAIFHRRKAM